MIRSGLLGLLLFGFPLAAWALFVDLPRVRLSRYRYQLWAIRDELADLLLSGEIERTNASVGVLAAVEHEISGARTYLGERALIANFLAKRMRLPYGSISVVDIAQLAPRKSDKALLSDICGRVHELQWRYLVFSPLLLIPLGPLSLVGGIAGRIKGGLQRRVRNFVLAEAAAGGTPLASAF